MESICFHMVKQNGKLRTNGLRMRKLMKRHQTYQCTASLKPKIEMFSLELD